MDFFGKVWRYPYLWHIVWCIIVAFYMCFAQYKKTEYTQNVVKDRQYYVHLYVYMFIGLLGGIAAYVAISGGEGALVIIFGCSLGAVIAISEDPPKVIIAFTCGYVVTCSVTAETWIPISVYVFFLLIAWHISYKKMSAIEIVNHAIDKKIVIN